jgi:AraC-like DNA-binding protein
VRNSALVGSLSAVQVSVLPRVIEAQPLAMSAAVSASGDALEFAAAAAVLDVTRRVKRLAVPRPGRGVGEAAAAKRPFSACLRRGVWFCRGCPTLSMIPAAKNSNFWRLGSLPWPSEVGYDARGISLAQENGAKAMAAKPTVDARWACLVADLLEAKQVEPEGLLRQAGLSRRQVSDPDQRIPFRKHALLFELAAEACREPYFGLRLGAHLDVRDAGLLGYVALSSPTFGQALNNVARYHRVLTEGFQLSFELDEHHAVLAAIPADPLAMVGRQAVEFGTSALVRMCRGLTAQKLRPLWVQFVHPLPRAKARYAAALKAPVYFDQPQIAVVFSKEVLAVPVKRADHRLLRILETHCCEILGQGAESDAVFDVRQVLTRHLSGGVSTLAQMAAELNTSVRTLERRLKERGWTYKQVVDDLRRQLALRYVKDRRLRLSQMGFLLGFSENAAFLHAFRRWTGSTPVRYRAANSGDHALDATRSPVASRHGRQTERPGRTVKSESAEANTGPQIANSRPSRGR